jgi:hypothetical protein
MLNIDWSKITNPGYWLEGSNIGEVYNVPVIDTSSEFFYFFIILFGGLLVGSILINVYKLFLNKVHPLQPKLSILGFNLGWMGFLGLVWFGLRELQVSFLSSRLWLLIGILWFLALVSYFIWYFINFYKLELGYFNSQIKTDKNIDSESKKAMKIAKSMK